ncbi:endopeptidase La [Mariprofundus ferrooxydans]|uniref:Lon protease n=1 Tax=Mariprofundus ferrooxydans PV-1 TaxID=314345 RepID=Q0EZH3_9PROT|nr:endopeptidase La [Mariprofundus ferrooxydans]EAU54731.1 ATP-dependent protease La [Mariprofundus ferrooxydans PV-1]KON46716.1 Lon protease [Mariprofundus ferrooxydans]
MNSDTIHSPESLDAAAAADAESNHTNDSAAGPDTAKEGTLVRSDEVLPKQLTLLPLSNRPLFPGLVVPLIYEGGEMGKVVRALADSHEQYVGLVLVRDEGEPYAPQNLFEVGVVARIAKAVEIEGHGLHLVVECMRRFSIDGFITSENPIRVAASYRPETAYDDNIELRAYTVAVINTIKELLKHNPMYEEELRLFASRFDVNEPNRLADFAASLTTASREDLQDILETYPIFDRLKKVVSLLNRELNVSKVQTRIRENIDERISEQQRHFFLQEQLQEIQRELGMNEDPQEKVLDDFRKKAKKLDFSTEAGKAFDEEMNRLSMLDSTSPEYNVTRSYLEWLTWLPWGKYCRERYNLKTASRALNKHHSGLDDVKDRILEFIAVGARKKAVGGSIILFVGPPGVGKTSLGKAIAEAVNRPFFRFSVGGMRDEAEIKGHRRTYIGAMPGKIVQALKRVEVSNPVIMIDEVDKIGSDFRGDPASALLEVLDPEQNSDFMDHYLDVRFDLSQVLFLLTANQLDTVPGPLLDRAEIIRLPGYMASEKVEIARKHLWPNQLKEHALDRQDVSVTSSVFRHLVEDYAREPGVRRLEGLMKKILRKLSRNLAEEKLELPVRIGVSDIKDYIGLPRFREQAIKEGVGLATGLAWTAMGGTTLTLEAAVIHHDQRGMKITGQLGKVMQESSDIAYSYISANLERFGAPADFFDKAFVHMHVPEGAVPKDGPSAGITMATALLSLALGKAPAHIAMTGEMTLVGEVLPIGGEREKLLAVKRLGITEVILPVGNKVDVDELPESVREGITIHYARHFSDVARLMFGIRMKPATRRKTAIAKQPEAAS